MIFQKRIHIRTHGHGHVQDVTPDVQEVVAQSGIQTGIVHVFNIGSTGCVTTIEFEPGLARDLPSILDRLIPASRDYAHEAAWADGNAHSHLQASVVGASVTVPISKGRMVLGTWQQIVHVECDIRPRSRDLVVTVIGE